jgi:hypothetical protein
MLILEGSKPAKMQVTGLPVSGYRACNSKLINKHQRVFPR